MSLRLSPGDVVLVHPKLAYDDALNLTADLSYQLVFRLARTHCDAPSPQTSPFLFRHFAALRGTNGRNLNSPSREFSNFADFDELAGDLEEFSLGPVSREEKHHPLIFPHD